MASPLGQAESCVNLGIYQLKSAESGLEIVIGLPVSQTADGRHCLDPLIEPGNHLSHGASDDSGLLLAVDETMKAHETHHGRVFTWGSLPIVARDDAVVFARPLGEDKLTRPTRTTTPDGRAIPHLALVGMVEHDGLTLGAVEPGHYGQTRVLHEFATSQVGSMARLILLGRNGGYIDIEHRVGGKPATSRLSFMTGRLFPELISGEQDDDPDGPGDSPIDNPGPSSGPSDAAGVTLAVPADRLPTEARGLPLDI